MDSEDINCGVLSSSDKEFINKNLNSQVLRNWGYFKPKIKISKCDIGQIDKIMESEPQDYRTDYTSDQGLLLPDSEVLISSSNDFWIKDGHFYLQEENSKQSLRKKYNLFFAFDIEFKENLDQEKINEVLSSDIDLEGKISKLLNVENVDIKIKKFNLSKDEKLFKNIVKFHQISLKTIKDMYYDNLVATLLFLLQKTSKYMKFAQFHLKIIDLNNNGVYKDLMFYERFTYVPKEKLKSKSKEKTRFEAKTETEEKITKRKAVYKNIQKNPRPMRPDSRQEEAAKKRYLALAKKRGLLT